MRLAALLALVSLSGCLHHRPPPPALVAHPQYFLGDAYQAGGHWYYPAEAYGLDETGLASVQTAHPGLTANGEIPDPSALTASMQAIQLPAIAEITNLENGRQIEVRVNDRGPASPGRLIAVSPRAALLLAMPQAGGTRVRVRIDEGLSRALVEQLGGGPRLQVATAPRAAITAETLPAPGGGPAGPARSLGQVAPEATGPRVPDRLPERIIATYANPGQLMLHAGSFGRVTYARAVAARLAGLGGEVVRSRDGRQTSYAVVAGPFATVAQADAALAQALAAGVVDARISVD